MRINFIIIVTLLAACSIVPLLPEACVTIKVLDEEGRPLTGIPVGIGFERNTGSGVTAKGVDGVTNSKGEFTAQDKSNRNITYIINFPGYYLSYGKFLFERESAKKWQPWNPELKLVLRKIENPVPMYARQFSKLLPLENKDIGCDLIANDWVKPYGTGTHSDITFRSTKKSVYDDGEDYDANLYVKFSGKRDGFIKYELNMYSGSEFKLPRYAPIDGYQKEFKRHVIRPPGRSLQDDKNDNIGYVFRVRSASSNSVMYGKIQRDIGFRAGGKGTAGVDFTYYLNPDHTRNLEFDPKRNLFTDLKSYEQIGL